MDKLDGALVFSLVLIACAFVFFIVPVLPKGSPWQSGNPSNGTPDGSQKEPSLKVLSAGWPLSGVSFRIKNTGTEPVTLTAIYLGTEWGNVMLYAQPLTLKPSETADISAYMTWTGGETYAFKFVTQDGSSLESAFTSPAGGGG